MLKYSLKTLKNPTLERLKALQSVVNRKRKLSSKYDCASRLFKSKRSPAWREIRDALKEAAPGGDACYYCERDRYRDIEHIQPKRHYPQFTFIWENYVYACTICNQDRKKDTYGIIDSTGKLVVFDRTHDMTVPIPVGVHALINIRNEDPLDFLMLDLDTGMFVPIRTGIDKIRGEFTRDLFDLNGSELPKYRRYARKSFEDFLQEYKKAVLSGDLTRIETVKREILSLPYPTVLVEMRRQATINPSLTLLFDGIPAEIGKRI